MHSDDLILNQIVFCYNLHQRIPDDEPPAVFFVTYHRVQRLCILLGIVKCFDNYSLDFFISRLVALSSFCSSSIRSFSCS